MVLATVPTNYFVLCSDSLSCSQRIYHRHEHVCFFAHVDGSDAECNLASWCDVSDAGGTAWPGEGFLGPHPKLGVAPQPFAQVQPEAHPLDVVGGVRFTWDDCVQRRSAEQKSDYG